MADVPSAVAYGTAAQGQAVYGTSASTAVWAYSAWDTSTVTVAAGLNAGTGPAAPAAGATATIVRGTATFGSGTTPTAGSQMTVAFSSTLPSVPVVVACPTTAACATLSTYITAVTATGFTVSSAVTPTATQAGTVYGVAWYLSL